MKKKLLSLVLSLVTLTSLLTSCGFEEHVDVKSDKDIDVSMYYYYTDEEVKESNSLSDNLSDNVDYVGKKTYDGVEYSVYKDISSNSSEDNDLEKIMTVNGFYYSAIEEDSDESQLNNALLESISPFICTITFPNEITDTNGKLSEDKKTVTFEMADFYKNGVMYAYNDTYKASKKAEIVGLEQKSSTQYVKKKSYKIIGFTEIKSVTLNGTELGAVDKITLKSGKNEVEITNEAGTSKYKIVLDSKAPTVKGIKDKGKYKKSVVIKATDTVSGIKEATLNGKNISVSKLKKGYKVSKKGTYVFYIVDKASNSKVINFTIK